MLDRGCRSRWDFRAIDRSRRSCRATRGSSRHSCSRRALLTFGHCPEAGFRECPRRPTTPTWIWATRSGHHHAAAVPAHPGSFHTLAQYGLSSRHRGSGGSQRPCFSVSPGRYFVWASWGARPRGWSERPSGHDAHGQRWSGTLVAPLGIHLHSSNRGDGCAVPTRGDLCAARIPRRVDSSSAGLPDFSRSVQPATQSLAPQRTSNGPVV